MNNGTERKEERRQRIMAEAGSHFLRHGFGRTSLDRIAAGAKVSKQAIYEYFRSKEDLFEQVVRAELRAGTRSKMPIKRSLEATLEQAARDMVDQFGNPRNFGLFRANIVATPQFPVLSTALHEYRRGTSEELANYLEALIAEKQITAVAGSGLDLSTRLGSMAVEGIRFFLGEPLPSPRQRGAQARLAARIFLRGCGDRGAMDPPLDLPLPPAPFPSLPGVGRLRLSPDRFSALCTAATNEFLAMGFDGANIDRIIAASGVGRSTIYRRFTSKEGLFHHVISQELNIIRDDVLEAPPGVQLEARMTDLARLALDRHLQPRSLALHHLLVQEADAFPDLARSFYQAQVARLTTAFLTLLDNGRLPLPGPATIRLFHTLATFGARYIATSRPVPADERDLVSQQAARIICRGLS